VIADDVAPEHGDGALGADDGAEFLEKVDVEAADAVLGGEGGVEALAEVEGLVAAEVKCFERKEWRSSRIISATSAKACGVAAVEA
jgi:hypothetical protein